jgi:hypothetical protein
MRLLTIILLSLIQGASPTITGHITSTDNQAIAGATVMSQRLNSLGGYSSVEAQTDSDGKFSLAVDGRVLFVRKAGFVPVTRILGSADKGPAGRNVQVTLEPVSDDKTLYIPRCQKLYGVENRALVLRKFKPKGVILYGDSHLYPVPDNARVEHMSDNDYGVDDVVFRGNHKTRLRIYRGMMWIGFYPDIHLFDNAAEFSERALSTGENSEEIRGTLRNGNKFRWVGAFNGEIFYYDAPLAAAAYFDRIIDQGCLAK